MSDWRIENKYSRWYDLLMARACLRQLEQPYERHHVWPRSLGGGSSGTVCLTFREHFLAHWLLTKFTKGGNRHKMLFALARMTTTNIGTRVASSWQYELARKAQLQALKERWRDDPEYRERILKASRQGTKEKWEDPEFRASQTKILTQAVKDAWQDPEIRAQIIASMKETANTPDALAANAERARTQWQDPAFQELMSDPDFLKKRGAATAESNRQRVWTPEATAKRVEKFKAFYDAKRGGPKPPPPGHAKGEDVGNAKLTPDIVREIRRLEGVMKRPAIAEMFGLNVWHVRDIQKRRCWKHVK